MTYDDIVDWSEENLPMELYDDDDFETYIKDLEANFARHGHYFPPSVIQDLADEWGNRFDVDVDIETIREKKLEAEIEQASSPKEVIAIKRKSKLKPQQIAKVHNRLAVSGFQRGRKQAKEDFNKELRRKLKRQEQRIALAKKQKRSKSTGLTKRQKRRLKGKEKQRKKGRKR